MKFKVIFYFAIAICFDLIASLPYSVDLQRYSGFKTRPALESSFQANAPRPYKNLNPRYDSPIYRTPVLKTQEQKLPRVNRDNVFSRNQQRYLPKGPPQPVEILKDKYVNQQTANNEYLANRHQYQDRPVEVQQFNEGPAIANPSDLINTEPFIPAIPPVPLSNEAPRWVDDHYLLEKPLNAEQILPIIQPLHLSEEYKRVPKIDDFDRFFAKASDPVEQISEPKRQPRPQIERLLSHPRIRNILETTKQNKRYLVIHPNGTVEHVDKLDAVAEKHPNYFLVHAGDILANKNKGHPVIAPPQIEQPLLVPNLNQEKDLVSNIPEVPSIKPVLEIPEDKPTTIETKIPNQPELNMIGENIDKPSTVEVEAVVKEPLADPPIVTIEEVPITSTPALINIPQVQHSVQVSDKTTSPILLNETISDPQLEHFAPVGAPVNDAILINLPPMPVVNTESPPLPNAPEKANGNSPQTITETSIIQPNSPGAVNSSQNNLPADLNDAISAPLPDIEDLKKPDDYKNLSHVDIPEKIPEAITPPEIKVIDATEKGSSDNLPIKPLENDAFTVAPAGLNLVEDIVSKIDEYLLEEPDAFTTSPEVDASNVGDLDTTKAAQKPSFWFRTTDPDFWKTLAETDTGFDIVYFFQVHNQPKIERDIKQTIHPNGTIVEDVVESAWDFEGDKPRVTKTTKVIHPEDL